MSDAEVRAREDLAFSLCVARTARLVAAETQRCAKIADEWARDAHPKSKTTAEGIAADIRSGEA